MKNLFVLLFAVIFISGCAGMTSIHISDDASTVAGTAVCALVNVKYPSIAKQALPYAQGLLVKAQSGMVDSAMLTPAIDSLLSSCGMDASLRALLETAATLVDIQVNTGTVNTKLIDALNGCIKGFGG